LGAYLVLAPYFKERAAQKAAQPPALPTGVTPVVPGPRGGSPTGTSVLPPPTAAELQNLTLEQQARSFAERIGSGASTDGFLGYDDAFLMATAKGREALRAAQAKMREAHPAAGTRYGISTRSVAARVIKGTVGQNQVVVEVDAVERIDAAATGGVASATGKRLTITFVKQANSSYLVDAFTSQDLKL
jgi:hypothetical protein